MVFEFNFSPIAVRYCLKSIFATSTLRNEALELRKLFRVKYVAPEILVNMLGDCSVNIVSLKKNILVTSGSIIENFSEQTGIEQHLLIADVLDARQPLIKR